MIDKDMLNAVVLLITKYRKLKGIPEDRMLTPLEITSFFGGIAQVLLQHEGINNKKWGLVFHEDIDNIEEQDHD